MTDITRVIEVEKDDRYRLSVSAPSQPPYYEIRLYPSDGAGGFLDGHVVGRGDGTLSQWIGIGSEIEGALVRVCATHGSKASDGRADIIVQLELERSPGVVEALHTWKILNGFPPGEFKCLTLQFK